MYSTTTGTNNVAVGSWSAYSQTVAQYNTMVGSYAGYTASTASLQTHVGYEAGYAVTSAAGLAAVGYRAGRAVTTGNYNTIIGTNAAYSGTNNLTTGSNNTVIGYNAAVAAAAASNTITLGNASIATLRCQVQTISALSDARDKTDIEDNELGLDFIMALKTRKFRYNPRERYKEQVLDEYGNPVVDEDGNFEYTDGVNDGSKANDYLTEGFVAQELQEVIAAHGAEWLRMVDETNPDKLEAASHKVVIPLVKAVQELAARVVELEAKCATIETP